MAAAKISRIGLEEIVDHSRVMAQEAAALAAVAMLIPVTVILIEEKAGLSQAKE